MKFLLLCALVAGAVALSADFPPVYEGRAALDESFGYVDVRPGVHMFWVTYETENSIGYNNAPLIMWLQGGPGASGVGYGNFAELGPADINGNLRDGRWTKKANLMFVDNPVGAGYSYVDDLANLTTTNQEIADDLLALVKSVFTTKPEYQTMPFYVYCESYGGKMAADFALTLDAAIKNSEINANFKGVGLGDSWISPIDSVNTWGSFLYSMGFASAEERQTIDNSAKLVQNAIDAGDWAAATTRWSATEAVVLTVTNGVDFYNVLAEEDVYKFQGNGKGPGYLGPTIESQRNGPMAKDALDDFMNSQAQKDRWNIPSTVTWGSQSNACFNALNVDFMKPVITSVANLIDNTDIHVAVYTGDLDLICDTPGTYLWVNGMTWADKAEWLAADRVNTHVASYGYRNAGYYRVFGNFSLHTFIDAGHMVPLDAPEASLDMISTIYEWTTGLTLPSTARDEETVAEKTHKKPMIQIEELPQKMQEKKMKKQKEEKLKEVIKTKRMHMNEEKDRKEREYKAKVSTSFKSRATPQGRRFHKERHVDRTKPIFHQ